MKHNLRQVTEIMHTIFCRRPHELDMTKIDETKKCCYYLENTIEDTWEQPSHKIWVEQAEFFMDLSKLDIEIINQMLIIYKAVDFLKQQNPLFMKYVKILLEEE